MCPSFRAACASIAFVCFSSAASAHDFWIEPSAHALPPGADVQLALRVGHPGAAEVVERASERIERFELVGPSGESIVAVGEDGADPAGRASVGGSGWHVAVYRSHHAYSELAPAAFESYLKEEGLEAAAALRAKRKEQGQPGREIYSRCAKALLRVGDSDDGWDRVVGLPLEIVPKQNPALPRKGKARFRVLFRGAPLVGVLVKARGPRGESIQARTNRRGTVSFALDAAGPWLVTAVHMVELPPGANVQWESLWASLRFETK